MTARTYLYSVLILLGALILEPLSGESFAADYVNVRVSVARDKKKILLRVKGPYRIEALNSDLVLDKARSLKNEYVLPTTSGLKIGEKEFKVYGIRIIPEKDATIFIDKNRLRGIVDIIRTEKKALLVVNHLDVEKYLYGVLYHEMPHYWPMEALKAQAVAARTFALYRKKIMVDKDYDVTSDIYSQVYGGHSSERRQTRKAVDQTKGKALTYEGEILPSYYHSICAGRTENANEVFGIDLPPLKGVLCPYCRGAKGMRWKASFSLKDIEKRLNAYGIKVKGLTSITAGKREASGRLKTLKIKDKNGSREIKGYKFRLALGPNKIRSTDFTIKTTRRGVYFKGEGWGHGVGMCQWGVFGMAKKRYNYQKILRYYYPGAKIETVRF